jgi:hypothetical protein
MTPALCFRVIHERNSMLEHGDAFFCCAPGPDLAYEAWIHVDHMRDIQEPYNIPESSRQGRPLIPAMNGRFKTAHADCYLSAKAYSRYAGFATALYGALL